MRHGRLKYKILPYLPAHQPSIKFLSLVMHWSAYLYISCLYIYIHIQSYVYIFLIPNMGVSFYPWPLSFSSFHCSLLDLITISNNLSITISIYNLPLNWVYLISNVISIVNVSYQSLPINLSSKFLNSIFMLCESKTELSQSNYVFISHIYTCYFYVTKVMVLKMKLF